MAKVTTSHVNENVAHGACLNQNNDYVREALKTFISHDCMPHNEKLWEKGKAGRKEYGKLHRALQNTHLPRD